jgi:trehalose 6-phosphate synthase
MAEPLVPVFTSRSADFRSDAMRGYFARMLEGHFLVLASSRGPVEYRRSAAGALTGRRGSGGLVTALSGLMGVTDAVWIACAMTPEDREVAAAEGPTPLPAGMQHVRLRFILPTREEYDRYSNVISNPLLWFIQHYLWDLSRMPVIDAHLKEAWDHGYMRVNQLLADRVVDECERAARRPLVMLQDYHFYLAPAMIRARHPRAVLQHFIHIPWPTAEYWKILPEQIRNQIVEGLLGNSIIGFHTETSVWNFLVTCQRLLHLEVDLGQKTVLYQGRPVWVRAYPISINIQDFERRANSLAVEEAERSLLRQRPDYLLLRVDRLDPSKNILRGFQAFDRLLQDHPELCRRIAFHALLVPSRTDVSLYRDYAREVRALVRELNERHGQEGWQPIHLRIANDMPGALAAYKHFDVLLANPIYDGMNLVAKEGMVVNRNKGVLVLSENAGAAEELGHAALVVNPFDVDQTARALYDALMMPEAQRARWQEAIIGQVRRNDLYKWMSQQLADVRDLKV